MAVNKTLLSLHKTICTKMELTLKNKIKLHRHIKDLSQEDLADKLGVTRNTVSNYETGKTTPDAMSCFLIAKAFGVTIEEIFSIEEVG